MWRIGIEKSNAAGILNRENRYQKAEKRLKFV